jgi:hypothetical protein
MTGYGRFVLWNATHLTFEQVANDNGTVVDSFVVVKEA